MKLLFRIFIVVFLILAASISFYFQAPQISVVMATYNRSEKFLSRSIESILSQTYKDFEFIIIDDGSTDQTAKIVQAYAQKDNRIRFFKNKENRGLIYSLNKGIDLARGKYIARMDDDDISLPERLEKQFKYMEKNPDIALVGTARYLIGYNPHNVLYEWTSQIDKEKAAIDALFFTSVSHPTWMIRRSFIQFHHIRYDTLYPNAEDRKFLIDIILAGGSIISLKEILLGYELGSVKKDNYYSIQGASSNKALRFAFEYFYPKQEVERILKEGRCAQYEALLLLPPEKNVFSRRELINKLKKACQEK